MIYHIIATFKKANYSFILTYYAVLGKPYLSLRPILIQKDR